MAEVEGSGRRHLRAPEEICRLAVDATDFTCRYVQT